MPDFSNTVLLKINFESLGNSRKVATSKVEVEADKTMIRVNKSLLDSRELENIRSLDGEVRAYLDTVCLPFEAGIRLLPVAAIEAVETKLVDFADRRTDLVAAFVAAYDQLREAARVRLNGLFDPRDYLPTSEVSRQFSMRHQYISFDAPASLRSISASVFEREREKIAQRMEDAYSEARSVLRETCLALVRHLRERLEVDPATGKAKRLHSSTVENLREFLDGFNLRNITDDAALAEVVQQARAVIAGTDADSLRDVDTLRANVRQQLEAIETQIDNTLVTPHGRRVGAAL